MREETSRRDEWVLFSHCAFRRLRLSIREFSAEIELYAKQSCQQLMTALFQKLPREIRDMIYTYLCVTDAMQYVGHLHFDPVLPQVCLDLLAKHYQLDLVNPENTRNFLPRYNPLEESN